MVGGLEVGGEVYSTVAYLARIPLINGVDLNDDLILPRECVFPYQIIA